MCCFSGPVESVGNTRIFARGADGGRQFLVYSMKFSSKADVAMVLPLPVPAETAEDAVRFIDLSGYKDFFQDLESAFTLPAPAAAPPPTARAVKAEPLKVVEVGDFEASFVPTLKDFSRLDERFRLSDRVWDAQPEYRTFGFAVFKLKKETRLPHPMAFEFPRADPKKLFYPTVHIHDGKVHRKAVFDHVLYGQGAQGESGGLRKWKESELTAAQFMKVDLSNGILDGAGHAYRLELRGERNNEDTVV
jgi:hypothetical protein